MPAKEIGIQIMSLMELKLQDTTAESLSLARAQRMNWNTVGKFFHVLEKLSTEKRIDYSSYCEENSSKVQKRM
jgi:hypothetical protein